VFAHTQIYYGGFGLNSILVPVTEMKNDYSMLAKFEERAVKEFIRQNNKNHIVRATKLNSIYLGEDWREEIIREFYELREGKCKYVIRDSVNSVILSEKKQSKIIY
jgi:hypothetical protein